MAEIKRESFYAIRHTDGVEIYGEYAWMACNGPDDWTVAEEGDHDQPTEYEIVRMVVEPIAKRSFGEDLWPDDGDERVPSPAPVDLVQALAESHRACPNGSEAVMSVAEMDTHAAEHVCVPKDRWPTADEVAELRDTAKALPTRHARRINAFLDRLDPPAREPQAVDDVDWRALSVALVDAAAAKDYKAFAAVANRVRAARAALNARRQS